MRIRRILGFFSPNLKRVNQSKMCVAILGGGGKGRGGGETSLRD